jgi:hypothetical protein
VSLSLAVARSLSIFPQHLCALDRLELLDLQANYLMTVPRAVGTMPALTTLLLATNPLTFPPAGVVAQGPHAVIEYVRRHRLTDLMTTDAERSLKQARRCRLPAPPTPPAPLILRAPPALLRRPRRCAVRAVRAASGLTCTARLSPPQVLAQRDRLATSVDAHEYSQRQLATLGHGSDGVDATTEDEFGDLAEGSKEAPLRPSGSRSPTMSESDSGASVQPPPRSRNATFFD